MNAFIDYGYWVKIKLEKKYIEYLTDSRVFSSPRESKARWSESDEICFRKDTVIEPYCGYFHGNVLFEIGSFSFSFTPYNTAAHGMEIKVGRYCSIGGGGDITGPRHPIEAASASTAFFDRNVSFVTSFMRDTQLDDFPFLQRAQAKHAPILSNDVWIGANVTLNPGIRIGNGAVVAGNSVVTRDVPDYAIVGGNPAQFIRYRFAEEIRKELSEIQLWRFNLKDLSQFDLSEPQKFITQFQNSGRDITPFSPKKINLWESYRSMYGV